MTNSDESKIMHKELSYKLQGLFFDIRNDLGSGHKESIYQKALEKELLNAGIKFVKEPAIKIYSQKGDFLGLYRPDFLIEDKILIELKAVEYITKQEIARAHDYLRNSQYELEYLVNFATPQLFVKRLIFTNDRKQNSLTQTNVKRIATKLAVFVAISMLFVGICGVNAAELYLSPTYSTVGVGEVVAVDVRLNSPEGVNSVEGAVSWPSASFELVDTCECGSVISFWLDKMTLNTAKNGVSFSGIVPGGYNGVAGKLFELHLRAKKSGTARLIFSDTRAFLNDGNGTVATLASAPTTINISSAKIARPLPEVTDTIPPEEFTPIVSQSESLFNNQWFVAFDTQDKQTGIERYEISESKIKNITGPWIVAQSPYLLKDQTLKSYIYIKAVDKKGNERVVMIAPEKNHIALVILLVLIVIILLIIWRKRRNK